MSDAERILRSYYDAVQRHDVDATLAHLADDFEIDFGGGAVMDKKGAAVAYGWDAGVGGRVDWRIVEQEERSIVVQGEERNDFLELLGIDRIPFRSTFNIDDDGRIARQTYQADWGSHSVPDAMAPAIEWARVNAPEDLAEAYPEERLVYSEASARRWVALLRQWRGAIADSV